MLDVKEAVSSDRRNLLNQSSCDGITGGINMDKLNFLPFFEADTGANGGGTDNPGNEEKPPKEPENTEEGDKTFTRDDLAKKIAAEKAKWQKELDEKEAEAKKLAQMNAEEKAEHERQKLQDKIDEYERKEQQRSMASEASKMLAEAELPHDEELLGLLVKDDADGTKKAVEVIKAYVARIKKESARQLPPSEGGKFNAGTDKKQSIAEMAKNNRII